MNNSKTRKAQNSPTRTRNMRAFRLTFDVNPRKLECFINPKLQKPPAKKPRKLKSTSLTNPRQESCSKFCENRAMPENPPAKTQPTDFFKQQALTDRVSKPLERKAETRKTVVGNSPDLAKAIMNEVLHKIEKEGIASEWNDEEPRRQNSDSNSDNDKQGPSAEVTLIWSRKGSLPAISDNDKSFFSTEGTKLSSGRVSLQNYNPPTSYFEQVQLMQPHFFTEPYAFQEISSYPEYYNQHEQIRPEEINSKRVFEICYETILRDGRTTIMIKNIPNKYSLKLLSEEIDEEHADRYDFLYIPFDSNNNCNVGYAFINFLCPDYLQTFYQQFHNRRWAKFRSEKICVLTYARLQGRQSLIEHFHNSKVLNQKDKKLRPMIKDPSKLYDLLEQQRNGKP